MDKFVHDEHRRAIALASEGKAAKQMAHSLMDSGAETIQDFDGRKLAVMRNWVHLKFSLNPKLAELLVATGHTELLEGNTWGDEFWGICPPGSENGENWLGKILMEERRGLCQI